MSPCDKRDIFEYGSKYLYNFCWSYSKESKQKYILTSLFCFKQFTSIQLILLEQSFFHKYKLHRIDGQAPQLKLCLNTHVSSLVVSQPAWHVLAPICQSNQAATGIFVGEQHSLKHFCRSFKNSMRIANRDIIARAI